MRIIFHGSFSWIVWIITNSFLPPPIPVLLFTPFLSSLHLFSLPALLPPTPYHRIDRNHFVEKPASLADSIERTLFCVAMKEKKEASMGSVFAREYREIDEQKGMLRRNEAKEDHFLIR